MTNLLTNKYDYLRKLQNRWVKAYMLEYAEAVAKVAQSDVINMQKIAGSEWRAFVYGLSQAQLISSDDEHKKWLRKVPFWQRG